MGTSSPVTPSTTTRRRGELVVTRGLDDRVVGHHEPDVDVGLELVGLAGHHPDAGAAVPAGAELFDLAVVEPARRRPLVLHEDLGEVATGVQGRTQHP